MTRRSLRLALPIAVFLLLCAGAAFAGDIKLRIVVVNPSQQKTQSTSIRKDLPKEVMAKDIIDPGGLEVDYDDKAALFFVYKNDVELAPGETKSFEIVIDDVWVIKDEKLKSLTDRTDNVMKHLKDTTYFQQADIIAKTIYGRINNIQQTQTDPNVTRQQHIAYYRENLQTVEAILTDIDKLEKILVAVGGPPNLDIMEKSKIDLKSPSQKTTWIVIAVILVFIFILAGAFFFTWHGQTRTTENIFSREKTDSFSEFKKPKAPGTEDSPPPPPKP